MPSLLHRITGFGLRVTTRALPVSPAVLPALDARLRFYRAQITTAATEDASLSMLRQTHSSTAIEQTCTVRRCMSLVLRALGVKS